jgi:hypothetical protein
MPLDLGPFPNIVSFSNGTKQTNQKNEKNITRNRGNNGLGGIHLPGGTNHTNHSVVRAATKCGFLFKLHGKCR